MEITIPANISAIIRDICLHFGKQQSQSCTVIGTWVKTLTLTVETLDVMWIGTWVTTLTLTVETLYVIWIGTWVTTLTLTVETLDVMWIHGLQH